MMTITHATIGQVMMKAAPKLAITTDTVVATPRGTLRMPHVGAVRKG